MENRVGPILLGALLLLALRADAQDEPPVPAAPDAAAAKPAVSAAPDGTATKPAVPAAPDAAAAMPVVPASPDAAAAESPSPPPLVTERLAEPYSIDLMPDHGG